LCTDWEEISRVSLYWVNIEMIKFWAPTPLGIDPKGAKFSLENSAVSQILLNGEYDCEYDL